MSGDLEVIVKGGIDVDPLQVDVGSISAGFWMGLNRPGVDLARY